MRFRTTIGILAGLALSVAVSLSAQGGDTTIKGPRFAAASVKRGQASQPTRGPMSLSGGTFEMANLPVRSLVTFAYRRRANEVVDLPKWAMADLFTVRAKAEGNPSPEDIRGMVRTLLAERFRFVAHEDTRPIQVWRMTLARKDGKPGSSLVRRAEACKPGVTVTVRNRSIPCPGFINWPGGVAIVGMPMAVVADLIGGLFLDLKVVDRTGLDGFYDATLDSGAFADGGRANDVQLPTLFPAIEEQLGLKLEIQREPMAVTVIDRVEQPSED